MEPAPKRKRASGPDAVDESAAGEVAVGGTHTSTTAAVPATHKNSSLAPRRSTVVPLTPPLDDVSSNLDLAEGLIDVACDLLHILFPNTATLNGAHAAPGSLSPAQTPYPLRTFVQEMIKRSCSSFATFELALLYLVRSENRIPLPTGHLQSFSSVALAPPLLDQVGSAAEGGNQFPEDEFSDKYLASPPMTPSVLLPTSMSGMSSVSTQTAELSISSSTSSYTLDAASTPSMPPPAPRLRTASGPATIGDGPPYKPLTHPSHCARRMLLSAMVVSWKYLHDKTYSSRAWSKITGLPPTEISANEILFLRDLLQWDMFVDRTLFWSWSSELEKAAWSAASMRAVRKERGQAAKLAVTNARAHAHSLPRAVPMAAPVSGLDELEMLAQIDDGSVRNYSASNLVYFLPEFQKHALARPASIH